MKNNMYKKVLFMLIILAIILLPTSYANDITIEKEKNIIVEYNTHVQDIGWQEIRKNGELAGTEGQLKRVEAIKINLKDADENIKIKYKANIEENGWQDWKYDGELAGTEGESKKLEAIKIELEGTEEYSVMYRVHIQDIGWQDWKCDGEIAGTENQFKRLEAIEIKIIERKPNVMMYLEEGVNGTRYYKEDEIKIRGWKMADVSETKIVAYLDENQINEDEIAYTERADVIGAIIGYGTAKQNPVPQFSFNIRTEGLADGEHILKIYTVNKNGKVISTVTSKIKYDTQKHVTYLTHVQDIGWQKWKEDGELAGTEGKLKRVEALKIKLINFPQDAKIKYQVHIEDIGWQEWKYDGELAGTEGLLKRVEAIKIELENVDEYSIEYRTYIENVGWQDWANDGETSGTEGRGLRVEAIEIRMVPKIAKDRIKLCMDEPANKVGAEIVKVKGWLMTNIENVSIKILFNDEKIDAGITRTKRTDVIEAVKGFGGEKNNPLPGFETVLNLSELANKQGRMKVQVVKNENEIIYEKIVDITIKPKIEYHSGGYGYTGLKIANQGGSDLTFLQYGHGENVFFATFAIHGYEDQWNRDGEELVKIANQFYDRLLNDKDYDLADKWTIYVFPGVNKDGLTNGWTKDGPGRTTLYSQAPNHKGIDLNRCWQVGNTYKIYSGNRNYNGTEGFQAYEAQSLRNFMLRNKSQNGQTILVDLHGWTQQLIGDETICSYYEKSFPENNKNSVGRYGTGYMIAWGRSYLGSKNRSAKTALIELPNQGVTGHQSVVQKNFANRYIDSTLEMLKSII